MSSNLVHRSRIAPIALACLLAAAPIGRAAVYAFTGAGSNNNWSTTANWNGGAVPQPSGTSHVSIQFPANKASSIANNDLPAGLDVGYLTLLNGGTSGSSIRVHGSVTVAAPNIGVYSRTMPIEPVGDVDLLHQSPAPIPVAGQVSISVATVGPLIGSGNVTLDRGVWGLDLSNFAGQVTVPSDAVLSTAGTVAFSNLDATGILDFAGATVHTTAASNTIDLSQATLDLARDDGTAGTPYSGDATFQGNVDLGKWVIGGDPVGAPNDRIDVSGTLDLTQSHVLAGAYASAGGAPVVFPEGNIIYPPSTVLILATYGNRLGTLDIDHLSGYSLSGTGPSYPIIYTSGENAGPGQILVLAPEPSTLLALTTIPLLARRRRPQ